MDPRFKDEPLGKTINLNEWITKVLFQLTENLKRNASRSGISTLIYMKEETALKEEFRKYVFQIA